MNTLILLSSHERSLSASLKEKILSATDVTKFFICPINFDLDDMVLQTSRFIGDHTTAKSEIIPFSRLLLDHSFKVKDDYIHFISQLGEQYVPPGVKIKEYFRYYSREFSTWWLSLIYEKSPGKTDTFLHFVKLSLIVEVTQKYDCREIWMSCAGNNAKYFDVLSSARSLNVSPIGPVQLSGGWRQNLMLLGKEWLRALAHLGFLGQVRARVHGWGLSRRPRLPEGCRRFAVTMFPFFDPQKLAKKKFYSRAYGPLQDGLDEDKDHSYAWLAMPIKLEPYTPQQSAQLVREIKEFDHSFFSVDEWIGRRDLCRILWDFLGTSMRFLRIAHRLAALTFWPLGRDITVQLWPILREDFVSSFSGKVLIVNLHYLRMFLNIACALPAGSTVIHFAEMHSWERCLQMACRSRGNIKVVALQHAHVPQLLLNYFDDPDDLKTDHMMQCVVQPHFLGSVGAVIKDYFSRQGWSQEKLFVVGGFRFQSLLQDKPHVTPDLERPYLVAAFSICYKENLEMLKMLQKAFDTQQLKLHIFIKSHPAESIAKMAVREKLDLDPNIFSFTDESLEKLMPRALGMFACSTSAVFYAMCCRRPVITPLLYDAIDLCPLTNLYPYEIRVENHHGLQKAVKDVLERRYDQNRLDVFYHKLITEYLCLDKDPRRPFNNLKIYLNK